MTNAGSSPGSAQLGYNSSSDALAFGGGYVNLASLTGTIPSAGEIGYSAPVFYFGSSITVLNSGLIDISQGGGSPASGQIGYDSTNDGLVFGDGASDTLVSFG